MTSDKSSEIASILSKASDEDLDRICEILKMMTTPIRYSNQDFDRIQYLSSALYDAGIR